uniref:Arginine-glutamic acid dipeptide repeats protein n=3 Tax=Hydra vulgaris TaxID=6087 RepID=T2M433_HYDVU
MTESLPEDQNKNQNEKAEEQITSYNNGSEVYHIGDTVYIESQRSDMPYYICSIRDFKKSKKENITIDVVWYYRPCEIPASVYQLLLQDRNAENGSASNILENPVVKERELFISDAIDMYPASALRGRASCVPFSEIKENVMEYISSEDNWFYILRYNPESRRMANAKGEIRIGASHQASLPQCIPWHERSAAELMELNQSSIEELVWEPVIPNSKLIVYIRAARSITSYNGYRDKENGGPEKALDSFSQDFTTAHSYDILHKHGYNISTALQYLIKNPVPKLSTAPWSDEERKKFMKGLRSYGKTFHKIQKELFPERQTSELVEYYYIWKKTATALSSRPHKRGIRRNNLVRKTRTAKPKTAAATEFLDLSSCSENDFNVCDDSENERDLSLYACRHCYTTKSPNWHHAGKHKLLLCYNCRMHFKRYGQMKNFKDEDRLEPPAYIYKAAFVNLEEHLQYSGRMRTRRSSTPIFMNGNNMRIRVLQEAKLSNRKQVTETEDKSNDQEKKASKRRNSKDMNENDREQKKGRLEADEDEDADDESEDDSETEIHSESNGQISNNSSESQSPETAVENELVSKVSENPSTFVPIKSEETCDPDIIPDDEVSSSSEVLDDVEKCEKISKRFKCEFAEPSCARSSMVYVFKRMKQRFSDVEVSKRHNEQSDKLDHEIKNQYIINSTKDQPAQITSYSETMRMYGTKAEPYRQWHDRYSTSHDNHSPRIISPREHFIDSGKFNHLLKIFDRQHYDHRHTSMPHEANHPIPFVPRSNDHGCDYRTLSGRSFISSHVPAAIENLSRLSSGIESIDRASNLDRPLPIDPVTGLPPIQPHLHSHLHTHTHLHVHPDDLKYRTHPLPSEAHHEKHEIPIPRQPQQHLTPVHRPRSREYHEHLLKQYPELYAQMHHDTHLSKHFSGNRDALKNTNRDAVISPNLSHEIPNMHNDPVAYHLWLTQYARMHHRWNSHSSPLPNHDHAPDLSPRGAHHLPHHFRNEHETILREKIAHEKIPSFEHEKIARTLEHEKYLRHVLKQREHEVERFKIDHGLHERSVSLHVSENQSSNRHRDAHVGFRTGDIRSHRSVDQHPAIRSNEMHSSYHGAIFAENIRRPQDLRTSHEVRSAYELSMHDRLANEFLERERLSQMERYGQQDRQIFYERTRHDRPSIFGRYKPETIDLSGE